MPDFKQLVKSAGQEVPTSLIPPAPAPLVVDPDAVAAMLFSTLVLYGPTGSRKTSQLGEFAKYIYEKTGKTTRLISMDGGGWGPIQDLINVGIIDAWRIVEEENPEKAIVKASKGLWPDKIVNGLRQGRATEPSSKENLRQSLRNVGAYAVEGWTSIANAVMRDAVAKGRKVNEDVVSKYTIAADDLGSAESFGAPSRGHYGFAQNLILDIIRNFSALPVERVAYTALEGKGEDRLTKALTYGPQVAGNAITASIPQYVGDCLHFEDFQKEAGVDPENAKQKLVSMEVRAWFTGHPDVSNGVIWPAKARIVPAKIEEFRAKIGKDGYFILNKDNNLYTYLKAQDEMLQSSSKDLVEWKNRIDAERAASK
jgi:hypothetical protein